MTRQPGSGSPHRIQSGGLKGVMPDQQQLQTGPRVGASSGTPQAAHVGAISTAMMLSASVRTKAPAQARLVSAAGSSLTSIRSASPQSRSSE